MLSHNDARTALTSSCDLARVKVTRRDPKTKKPEVWILDCSRRQAMPDFWLRGGDEIEVAQKP